MSTNLVIHDEIYHNGQQLNSIAEPDSDAEDDPGKLLNAWLGQLNKDIQRDSNGENGFLKGSNGSYNGAPVVKRRNNAADNKTNLKTQYRCSLINLEDSVQDEELDAILGELSVLESQFEEEIAQKTETATTSAHSPRATQQQPNISNGPIKTQPQQHSPVASVTSSSDSGTQNDPQPMTTKKPSLAPNQTNGKRTDSPDTDSAFCDNLSVLSSCSTSSRSNATTSGMSSANSTSPTSQEDQEAKIKAEKIKLAIEKIKEANVKKLFIKVFASDGSAKSILVDEKMSVSHVTRILAEKNHVKLDPRWTLVELIPDLYMERVYEDHENLVENCLMWKVDSKNTLWFIERPEKYDVFTKPERYLLGTSSSQQGDTMEDHARQELLEEYFSSSGVGAPEMEGFVWLKADNKKSWKKFFFVLRTSGLYYAPKGKKSSKDLVCLATFDVNQVYYGAGWKKKYKSPSEFCFAIKHPKIQAKTPKYTRYLCVDTEMEMHQWVTGIRVAKNGKQLFSNYRSIEEEITHADIDILTSKRFSVNSPPNSLPIQQAKASNGLTSPARTPSSENKSLDSALSSGIVSDISNSASRELPDIIETTPVNTIERNSGQLRRSMSKTSSTSSSSGCLSDRCSSSGSHPQHPNGFESDYPMGGTIKKRPSIIANPKLPLTNITRGLIRDSEDDSSSLGSGDNVRVGGGGTLLRSAVRHSLRKNSYQHNGSSSPSKKFESPASSINDLTSVSSQVHTVQVHTNDVFSQQVEEELNCLNEEELPPPPRAESIDQHLNQLPIPHTILPPQDVDDLPPPPPELTDLPPPPPPANKKPPTPVRKPTTKRISFDDDVQVIGISELDLDIEQEQKILSYLRQPYNASPKKLFTPESECQAAPPKAFLQDLQKVMNKKWQVAEKCREDMGTSPHQVLGFRDNELNQRVGNGENYSRDESVGAWVLQSQQYASTQQIMVNHVQKHQEPLYAACAKNGYPTQMGPQQPMPSHYAASPKRIPSPSVPPVVLREPTPPEIMGHQQTQYPPHHMNNMRHCPQPQRNLLSNVKRAPPPPKRSEKTQLTTTS